MGPQPYSAANHRARHGNTLLATLLLLLVLSLCVSAGLWQLRRAAEKTALETAFDAGTAASARELPVNELQAGEYRYRRFRLQGEYLPTQQVLLDNIVDNGRIGYQVLTPFRTANQVVLVNRGWLPANPDRSLLPDVTVDQGPRTIAGRLNFLPRPGIKLEGSATNDSGWPRRMLYPSRDELSTLLDMALPDYQIWLDADQPDGYRREWQAVAVGPARHYGYAIQWFAFAALALFFYALLIVRQQRGQDEPTNLDTPND